MNEPWTPPEPPADAEELIAVDPRVIKTHSVGAGVACPSNPPPPVGWDYWNAKVDKVTAALGELTLRMLHDGKRYPMGAFVQQVSGGRLVAARVEWHNLQGKSNTKGCFRGVNLMRSLSEAPAAAHVALKRGSRSSAVTELQQKLNAAGAEPALKVDGDFGGKTEAAVKAFQSAHGIDDSGVMDDATWGALLAATND